MIAVTHVPTAPLFALAPASGAAIGALSSAPAERAGARVSVPDVSAERAGAR